MSSSETEVARYQKKEAYNHELITSEDFYVSEMDALITHIISPFRASCTRCSIKTSEVDFVFNIIEHIGQFHIQFLRIIRDELSCVSSFNIYIGFITMYNDYFRKYNRILDIVSSWTFSMEFREFLSLRLQNEKCSKYIDSRLTSFPWYLYRPFERIKQYYRFFKDLEKIYFQNDEKFELLIQCKTKIKLLYNKIKKYDSHFIRKTRLLEIQLSIFGNIDPIVSNHRYFIYNRMCQMKLNGPINKKTKKLKNINLFIFNDELLWCSKRGQFKRLFKFINSNLIYGIPIQSTANDPMIFIQYAMTNEYKKHKKYFKKNKNKIKKKNKKFINYLNTNESKENMNSNEIQIQNQNYGKPTKKILLLFVNESVRNQCLNKIKETQLKYHQYLSKKREQKLLNLNRSNSSKTRDASGTFSHTNTMTRMDSIESSITMTNTMNNILTKPLEIPQQIHTHFINHTKYSSQLSTPTASQMSQLTITINESDDAVTEIDYYSDENSKSKSVNNNFVNLNENVNRLKQSVSTEIHTIQEEDEDDVKYDQT